MIREAILFAGVLYILITLAQILDRPAIFAQGLIVTVALAIATVYYYLQDEHRLHDSEAIVIWAAVLLFVAYGALRYGGIV